MDGFVSPQMAWFNPPIGVSADGGFASKENLEEAKEMGAKDVCFPEKKGMKILKMVKSAWVFKNLLNWRAE